MEGFGTIGAATVSLADSGSDFRCRLIFAISSGAKTNLPRFIIPRIFCIWTKAFNSASGIPSSTETSCKVFKARGMWAFLQRGAAAVWTQPPEFTVSNTTRPSAPQTFKLRLPETLPPFNDGPTDHHSRRSASIRPRNPFPRGDRLPRDGSGCFKAVERPD
jgi:hypothetical protein